MARPQHGVWVALVWFALPGGLFVGAATTGCTQRVLTPVPRRPAWQPPPPPATPPALVERRVLLGHSVNGTPLELLVFGEGAPALFIMGGIHGDEPTSAYVARNLIQYLRDHREACVGRTVGILAAANPDGLAAGRRANANGVDLNRNFPARNWRPASGSHLSHGPRPASEPETFAILKAMHFLQPTCVVAIHAISGGWECNNYDGPAQVWADLLSRLNGYPVVARMGYATPGSFGSWAGVDRRIPVVTLELPKGQSGARSWQQNRAALLALIRAAEPTAHHAR